MLSALTATRAWRAVPSASMRAYSSGAPKSKHALLYREIFPPLLRVLAYSTATYFALHLTWELLDAHEQRIKQQSEIETMRNEIRGKVQAARI